MTDGPQQDGRAAPAAGQPPIAAGRPPVYDVMANDPRGELIDHAAHTPEDIAEITQLMQALGALREAENRVTDASQEYMKLGRTDMRALHYLIVMENSEQIATASMLASHLEISSASTTKLLDRLERGSHIIRSRHPKDGRALAIRITPHTRMSAMDTVGRVHAQRFHAAARLSSAERQIVIGFLRDTAAMLDLGGEQWAQGSAE